MQLQSNVAFVAPESTTKIFSAELATNVRVCGVYVRVCLRGGRWWWQRGRQCGPGAAPVLDACVAGEGSLARAGVVATLPSWPVCARATCTSVVVANRIDADGNILCVYMKELDFVIYFVVTIL